MEQNKNSEEFQGDFFDQLMFGSPSPQPQSESVNTESNSDTTLNHEPIAEDLGPNPEKSQIEYIIEIAQVVGPYLSKLSPMLSNLQSFFSNKK